MEFKAHKYGYIQQKWRFEDMDWTNTSLLAKEQKGQSRMSWFLSSFGRFGIPSIIIYLLLSGSEALDQLANGPGLCLQVLQAFLKLCRKSSRECLGTWVWQKNFMGMLWVCPTRGLCIEVMAISTERRMVIMIVIWDNPRKLDAMFKKAQNRVRILHDNSGWGPAILSRLAVSGLSDVFTTLKKMEK